MLVYRFFYCFTLCLFSSALFAAEIVDNVQKDRKDFGDWTVVCEEDVMMDKVSCEMFSTFYDGLASIYVQPNNKTANQVVIIIPNAVTSKGVKFRIGKNPTIAAKPIPKPLPYYVIPFSPPQQKLMLEQMKNGSDIFVRFAVADTKNAKNTKDITVKISLAEFQKALSYYNDKTR